MSKPTKPYSFDREIDRRLVPALKVHPNVLGDGGERLFAAGVADMDFAAPPVVLEALAARLRHGVFGYEAVPDDLMPAVQNWLHTRHGWQVEQNHILGAPNILNALAIAASVFTSEGDGIIMQPPVFFDFFDIIGENRRAVVSNPLVLEDGRYAMDYSDLERKAADPGTRMLFLCNPHNPVGRVWGRDELERLGDICAANGVLVVSDEIHGDIIYAGQKFTPFASLGPEYAKNCITCISPAKSFNIAACCAAFTIIGDDGRRQMFQRENSRLTVNKNNAFANVAMLAAYSGGAPWLEDMLEYLNGNLDLVRDRLNDIPGVDLVEPEGTFLLWLNFRGLGLKPGALRAFLREKVRWAITRGLAFGEEGSGFARLNIACPRSRLSQALDRLKIAVGG